PAPGSYEPGAGPVSDARGKRRLGQKRIVLDLRGGEGQPEVEPQVVGQAAQAGEHVPQAGLVAPSLMIALRPEPVLRFAAHRFAPLRFRGPPTPAAAPLPCRRGDQRSVSAAFLPASGGLTVGTRAGVQPWYPPAPFPAAVNPPACKMLAARLER